MNQINMISTTMWIQKSIRNKEIINKLVDIIVKRNDIFTPTIFYGGYLTNNKNRSYNPLILDDINLFVNSINDADVFRVVLTNSDRKKEKYYLGLLLIFQHGLLYLLFKFLTHILNQIQRKINI